MITILSLFVFFLCPAFHSGSVFLLDSFFFKLFLKFIFISISKFRSLFPLVSPLKVSFLVFIDLASSFVAFLKIIFSKILNRFLLD